MENEQVGAHFSSSVRSYLGLVVSGRRVTGNVLS